MTLPFSREQLDQMEHRMLRQRPANIGREDVAQSAVVRALTAATASIGFLAKFRLDNGKDIFRLLNPVVTMELFLGINSSGEAADWWAAPLEYCELNMSLPEPDDLPSATEVISLTLAIAKGSLIVKFVHKGGQHELLRLSPASAIELFLYIHRGAEGLGWFDGNGRLRVATEEERVH